MEVIRANIPIWEGTPAMKSEHVKHFIGTLNDRDLVKQLTLLRLMDANYMKETLFAYQRMKVRANKAPLGLRNSRPRYGFSSDPKPSEMTRVVRLI